MGDERHYWHESQDSLDLKIGHASPSLFSKVKPKQLFRSHYHNENISSQETWNGTI